jgi:hypothetical protein
MEPRVLAFGMAPESGEQVGFDIAAEFLGTLFGALDGGNSRISTDEAKSPRPEATN